LAVQSKWWLFAGSDEGGAATIAARFMDGEGCGSPTFRPPPVVRST
jgi:hypothetical protein